MPIDRAIQKILASAAHNNGVVGDDWYFNPQFMELVPRLIRYSDDSDVKRKGDEMSKRTEISYRNLKNGTVEFAGYKNVMTLSDIDKEISWYSRVNQYAAGRCYYAVTDEGNSIRIWNRKENVLGRDFTVGNKYTAKDWDFFIDFLTEAGERYGDIKADIKAEQVQKIII